MRVSKAFRWGIAAVVVSAFTACSDPFSFDSEAPEVCAASREWLPATPALPLFEPLPHPETECPFYRGGWQNFLIATQPDANHAPDFLSWPTIDTVFQSSVPHPADRSVLGDIKQAGGRQILIDQNGNPIVYGIHVNQAYADFITDNNLRTKEQIQNADPRLFFPAGVVELKSAWQIVEPNTPADDYITVTTTIPTLSLDADHHIIEDRDTPRTVTVRLLALHVVFTLPGHPEFIWATFEHSTGTPDTQAADGHRDVAPIHPGDVNPDPRDPEGLNDTTVVSDTDHVLYRAGTPANQANQAIAEVDLTFDPATQKFPGAQTSIYRMFPASKSNTVDPDDAISSLNHNVEALFDEAAALLDAADRRGHYRLVGAVWMDKPAFFTLDASLQNDSTSPFASEAAFEDDIRKNGSDSDFSILAGEDRLSSTAMESFTQAPDSFPNCFTCHNTQAVTAKGVPLDHDASGTKLLDPKLINVSHVLSQFILEETQP
jgi:hypothetical protein